MAQVTYWGFDDGTADDNSVNGGGSNGTLQNGAGFTADGASLLLDGTNQYVEIAPDGQMQLDQGTLIAEFTVDTLHLGTVFSRDSQGLDDGGHFRLQVDATGAVIVQSQTAAATATQTTGAGFYAAGDNLRVVYSWDAGTGGTWTVENLTQGTSYTEAVGADVTWDQGAFDEPITIGADQSQSGDNTADALQDFFAGSIDFVSVYDTPETFASSGVAGDGIVSGTTGADLIDDTFAGDPDGERIDNNDGVLEASGDADTVEAGAGNDTVIAGADNDSVNAGMNDDSVEGGVGDDLLFGDQVVGGGDGQQISPLALNLADVRGGSQTGDPDSAQSGDSVIYDNVGTFEDGTVIAARITLVSKTDPNLEVDLTGFAGAEIIVNVASDPTLEGEQATFRIDFIDTATGEPVLVSGKATWGDIDEAVGGQEAISINEEQFYGYETSGNDQLIITEDNGLYTATGASGGTNLDPSDQTAWFTGLFENQNGFEFTATTRGANSGFTLNGDVIAAPETTLFEQGDDTLKGELGNDQLYGNAGEDVLIGGTGDDTLFGGSGDDTLDGDQEGSGASGQPDGDDELSGETGNDLINGAGGNDTLLGGGGQDTLFGGTGTDDLSGGDGNDILNGGAGADTLNGDDGNDVLNADDDATGGVAGASDPTIGDVINGGFGSDVIFANGSDTVDGGEDLDGTDIDTLNLTDVLNIQYRDGAGNDVAGPTENGLVTFLDGSTLEFSNIETVNASGPDGYVEGTAGADLIDAAYASDPEGDAIDANDAILPGDAPNDDVVLGGDGGDTIIAGLGDDEIYGDSNDIADDPDAFGRTGDDVINGGVGDDTIFGQGGDDRILIEDGFGNDSVVGGETSETDGDVLDAQGLTQNATLSFSADEDGTLSNGSETASFEEIESFSTGSGDDRIIATPTTGGVVGDTGAGEDSISGGAGDDILNAGADNDTVAAGAGDDTVDAGAGDDSVDAGAGADRVWGREGQDSLSGGDGADTLTGGLGADTLSGDSGDDLLQGGEPQGVLLNQSGTDGQANAGAVADFPDDALTFEIQFAGDPAGAANTPLVSYATPTNSNAFLVLADADSLVVFIDGQQIDTGVPLTALFDNTDHSFSVSWDSATGDLITYIDGVETSNQTFQQGALIEPGGTLIFGQEQDAVDGGFDPTQTFNGTINEIRLWDDVRTQEEVAAFDDGPLGTELSNPNLIHDWLPASDGSGLDDIVGANDAPLSGDAQVVFEAGDSGDRLIGGAGNDTMFGGGGDDTFVLADGHGTDEITGNETGETVGDVVDATAMTADATLVFTGDEAGTLTHSGGTATFEEIEAFQLGAGDDTIDATADSAGTNIDGGAGDDLFDGGTGADTLSGGDDADTFIIDSPGEGIGDVIDGGSGGNDTDTLDLTGSVSPGGRLEINSTPDADGDGFDGTVTFFDAAGVSEGTLSFTDIEDIIPCFTTGSMIATNRGRKPVEELQVGDWIKTRDMGLQQLRWLGRKPVSQDDLARTPALRPVRIEKGALGLNTPNRTMLVSPQHRVLIANATVQMLFGEEEVLVAAIHLCGMDGIEQVDATGLEYFHIMFDSHQIVLSDGAWTESFQPADRMMDALGGEVQQELQILFPHIFDTEDRITYGAIRRSLKAYEAQVVLAA